MVKLQQLHPKVYAHFLQGYHVIRRSNRFWAGLPLDLAIEQILMKSVKTTGGLTQGRGISEIQSLVWLFSRPACLAINNTMQKFASVSYSTSDLHKEATQARIEHPFKKNDQIVNMASNNAVKVSHEQVNNDPQVLFQRLVTAGMSNDQLPEIFQYELSSFPPALFDAKNVMKAANKPALADAIWALMPQVVQRPSENDKYVADGGSLLHRIP